MFVTLTCAFRYGREDLDVLGLSFRKDLFAATYQAFPPMPNPPRPPTRLQERLLRKLGRHAHPFFFTVRVLPVLVGRGSGLCLSPGNRNPTFLCHRYPRIYPALSRCSRDQRTRARYERVS